MFAEEKKDNKISLEAKTIIEEWRTLRQNTNYLLLVLKRFEVLWQEGKTHENTLKNYHVNIKDKSIKIKKRKFENAKSKIITLKEIQENLTSNNKRDRETLCGTI